MQIRDLEKLLEVDLVERRRGDVALTEIGVEVARRGERILAASRDLVDFARHRRRILSGRLKLGIIPSLAPYLLPTGRGQTSGMAEPEAFLRNSSRSGMSS
jgi:LysR family transcriptional regulator, hydrogen peroxide-inducible genes activator